jgi:hypothetical protein
MPKAKTTPKLTLKEKNQRKAADVLIYMTNKTFTPETLPTIELIPANKSRYKSFKAFQDDIKSYFLWCADNLLIPSRQALTLWLGWYSDLYYNYIKKPGYADILKRTNALIAWCYELEVATGNIGAMFLLKARCGYREQSEVVVTGTLNVEHLYTKALQNTQKDRPKLTKSAAKRIEAVEDTQEAEVVDITPLSRNV